MDAAQAQDAARVELELRQARSEEAMRRLQYAGELESARTKAKLLSADVDALEQAASTADKAAERHRVHLAKVASESAEAVAARDEEQHRVADDSADLLSTREQLLEEQLHLQAKAEQYLDILQQLRDQDILIEQAKALECAESP